MVEGLLLVAAGVLVACAVGVAAGVLVAFAVALAVGTAVGVDVVPLVSDGGPLVGTLVFGSLFSRFWMSLTCGVLAKPAIVTCVKVLLPPNGIVVKVVVASGYLPLM